MKLSLVLINAFHCEDLLPVEAPDGELPIEPSDASPEVPLEAGGVAGAAPGAEGVESGVGGVAPGMVPVSAGGAIKGAGAD